ncbi:MAG: ribbon-helix-helix protein, CopG family [Planctomycetes bacterium]|nr:ribbon-helix-helix protein, CopG family [Planctomycetota bacterium]MBL7037965.1 ribbon-helix-helix protein, CopG family [Pirellulaceae bacterium]
MKTISLKLPDSLHAKLNRLSKQRGQTKSEMVRTALEHFLNGDQPRQAVTVAELAGDLLGSAEGPGDLSTNSKYMEGYGE